MDRVTNSVALHNSVAFAPNDEPSNTDAAIANTADRTSRGNLAPPRLSEAATARSTGRTESAGATSGNHRAAIVDDLPTIEIADPPSEGGGFFGFLSGLLDGFKKLLDLVQPIAGLLGGPAAMAEVATLSKVVDAGEKLANGLAAPRTPNSTAQPSTSADASTKGPSTTSSERQTNVTGDPYSVANQLTGAQIYDYALAGKLPQKLLQNPEASLIVQTKLQDFNREIGLLTQLATMAHESSKQVINNLRV